MCPARALVCPERIPEGLLQSFKVRNIEKKSCEEFFEKSYPLIIGQIDAVLFINEIAKVAADITVTYRNIRNEPVNFYIKCRDFIIDYDTNMRVWYQKYVVERCLGEIEKMANISSVTFQNVHEVEINSFPVHIGSAYNDEEFVSLEHRETAFQKRLRTFAVKNLKHIETICFLADAQKIYEKEMKTILEDYPIVKVGACFIAQFMKNENEHSNVYIQCVGDIIDSATDLKLWYTEHIIEKCQKKMESFEIMGSGWTFESILELEFTVNKYDAIKGSSYIPLPKFLLSKKAIINVRNDDDRCFMWAILSALYPADHSAERVSNYEEYVKYLNLAGIKFPTSLRDISQFEQMNLYISVNVYMFDEECSKVTPIRLTKEEREKHVNLLLLTEPLPDQQAFTDLERKSHYCWIKNLSRMISSQVAKSKRKLCFCNRCLQHFSSADKLDAHTPRCAEQNDCQITMPGPDEKFVSFNNFKNQLPVPFIIYADIESILKDRDINHTNQTIYQEHEAYSVGYFLKCNFDQEKSVYKSDRGPDCIKWFVNELFNISKELAPILRAIEPIIITDEGEEIFNSAKICHICEMEFDENDVKVRDHNHITGEFRGAAHSRCNILYQDCRTIPVVFHNLSGYDSHFFIREISTQFKGDVSIIPINDQKYISFTKTVDALAIPGKNGSHENIKLRFIDSFRFMASSLDKLASYLPSEKKKILHQQFSGLEANQLELLERKGVFPYDFVCSWEKLNCPNLPQKEYFYSILTDSHISTEEYEHAQKVWRAFGMQSLGEYSDLYLKTDILLLADVFENFRETCLEIYKLDPAHYFTAPGFSWDAMLRYTKVDIELFTDIDMLMFIERGKEYSIFSYG